MHRQACHGGSAVPFSAASLEGPMRTGAGAVVPADGSRTHSISPLCVPASQHRHSARLPWSAIGDGETAPEQSQSQTGPGLGRGLG
jgi:hypothetical protein